LGREQTEGKKGVGRGRRGGKRNGKRRGVECGKTGKKGRGGRKEKGGGENDTNDEVRSKGYLTVTNCASWSISEPMSRDDEHVVKRQKGHEERSKRTGKQESEKEKRQRRGGNETRQ